MAWFYLVLAGFLEILWVYGLKRSDGFSRLWPSLFTIIAMMASFFLLGRAVRELPLGTAYAIWTGIGAAGTIVVGIVLFGEAATLWRLFFLACIIVGIVGIKASAT